MVLLYSNEDVLVLLKEKWSFVTSLHVFFWEKNLFTTFIFDHPVFIIEYVCILQTQSDVRSGEGRERFLVITPRQCS